MVIVYITYSYTYIYCIAIVNKENISGRKKDIQLEKQYDLFYQEYKKKLIRQYPSLAKESIGTPPVSPFLIELTQSTVTEIKDLIKVFYKMTHLKNYKDLIHTDHAVYLDSTASESSLLMSYDFHLDQDNGLKLIEVNTHSSGYLTSDLVDQVQEVEKQAGASLLSLKKSFEEEWRIFSGQTDPPLNVLVVDHQIKIQKMYIEFLMYKDLINSWGWPCKLHEIGELSIGSHGELVDSHQKTVQMLYNRCTDFYFENLPELKEVFLRRKCCISPHPKEYLLLADKKRFCEWSSDDFLSQLNLTLEEKKKVRKAVPFTALVDSVSADELWSRRKQLFFKPLKGYGGKSVYRGKNISRNVFGRIMKESGIFQEMVPPAVFVDPSGNEWKYDIRAYVYKDQVQKLIARVYQGQLTHFQVPLSGFASVLY